MKTSFDRFCIGFVMAAILWVVVFGSLSLWVNIDPDLWIELTGGWGYDTFRQWGDPLFMRGTFVLIGLGTLVFWCLIEIFERSRSRWWRRKKMTLFFL